MASQFSPKVSEILAFSREEAARLASRSVGPEHLMLGLLRERNSIVSDILSQANIDMQSIKHDLEMQVRENDFTQPLNTQELVLNTQASNILKLAVLEARMQSTNTVEEQHLLLAILHDQANNGAKIILESNSISYEVGIFRKESPDQCALGDCRGKTDVPGGLGQASLHCAGVLVL